MCLPLRRQGAAHAPATNRHAAPDRPTPALGGHAGRAATGRGSRPPEKRIRIRGTAEQLLLMVWDRVPISDAAGAEVSGDIGELDQWSELIPTM